MDKFQKKVKDIQERVKTHGIVINRVPKNIREEFVEFAEKEFCEDYGMTLKYVWDHFKLWKMFFENMDFKLDEIREKLDQIVPVPIQEQEEKPEKLTMLSGRKVKGGIKQDGVTK